MTALRDEIEQRLTGRTGPEREREIIDRLRAASAAELDETLAELDTAWLFRSVDNHVFAPDHRDELVDLLARERRAELGIPALASVVRGMQRGRTGRAMEEAIRDIFLAHEGSELTRLKNELNLSTGRHDLEGLVFSALDDGEIRAAVLDHFAAHSSLAGARQTKTLSDIDDTAIARLHETRYPKGTVIPGLVAFYEALDRGPADEPTSRGDLTFVTARPSDIAGLMKGRSREALARAGMSDLSIMTGSLRALATHDAMAAKKVENIAQYAQLFPEYDLVFVGDSGQGDVIVAETICEAHEKVLRAAFIHDVVGLPDERRAELAERGVWVVDTYVAAAAKAHELGLIARDAVRRVVEDAAQALDEVEWDSPEQEAATRELHRRDATAALREPDGHDGTAPAGSSTGAN